MNRTARGIGVDAGLIMIGDIDYLKSEDFNMNRLKELGEVFSVPNGKYEVKWNIDDTYNGDIEGVGEIDVTGGKVFVCDPCYIIGTKKHEDWIAWLEENEYGENIKSDKCFIVDEMGGDGNYNVQISLEKIE